MDTDGSLDEARWTRLRESMKGYNWLSFFVLLFLASFLLVEYPARSVFYWIGWIFACQIGIAVLSIIAPPTRSWIKPYSLFFVAGCLGWSMAPVFFEPVNLLSPISTTLYGIVLLAMAAAIQNPLSASFRLSVSSTAALMLPFMIYQLVTVSGEHVVAAVVLVVGMFAAMLILIARTRAANTDIRESLKLQERLKHSHTALKEKRAEISELKQQNVDILDWDSETGLHSTTGFWKKIERLNSNEQGTAVSVRLPDLGHVNAAFGASVAEAIVKDMASKLKIVAREEDCLCRAGNTSFIAYFPEREIARETIREIMEMPAFTGSGPVSTEKNIGIAWLQTGDSVAAAIKVAVSNAAEAARSKHDKVTIVEADSGYVRNLERHSRLRFDLPEAIENDGLHLVYQPQHRTSDGQVIGFEALARWEHPELGRISPGDFVPVAEETGLTVRFGAWVVDRAIREGKKLAIFEQGLKLSINISPMHLMSDSFIPFLQATVEEHDVPPGLVTLEITESTFMDDRESYHSVLRQIRAMGFSIALDDFGTGYSSLAYLTLFPIDFLKVDRSLVARITSDLPSKTLFGCIMDMSQALELPVVVEGVEKPEQLDIVRDRGGELIQGFIFSPGLAAGDVHAYVQEANDTSRNDARVHDG